MPKRTAITNRQRLALRAHHKLKPYLTGVQLQEWFENEFGSRITPATISRNLSAHYDWVDNLKDYQLDAKKIRTESWPELEEALDLWIQQAGSRVTPSQKLLQEKARQFWPSFYPQKEMPKFSNGWFHRFRSRRNIRPIPRDSETAGPSINVNDEMNRIRQVMSQYSPKDIFNCDETALCWRMIPDQNITSRSESEQKKNKTRITVNFCTNSDASERLPMWIIGTEKRPQVFQASRINIENLGCRWRYNSKACMTEEIFKEWLCWFDKRMTGRNVLLLLDDLTAHTSAFKEVSPRLQNISVLWLLTNLTAKYQPLDQGIISTWKAYWKQQWLLYMISEFDLGYDPMNTMSILKAIRWAVKAWDEDLLDKTIQNCFTKISNRQSDTERVSGQLLRELQTSLDQLAISDIKEVMKIDQFLNPYEEQVIDTLETFDNLILGQFGTEEAEPNDTNEVYETLPKITASEALESLYRIRLFEEQQTEGNQHFLKELKKYEQLLMEKKKQNQYRAFSY